MEHETSKIDKKEESSDTENDDKSSDIKDKACEHETNIGEEEEWMEYEQPIDLVDVHDESDWCKFIANAYIDLNLPMNVMSLAYYNTIRSQGYEHKGLNFVGIGMDMHVFVGNMSYVIDFTILENVEANIDPNLS
ncbi:hypothetical protein Tco_1005312 [Tanacetum coccineum]|uniref:Uncharacterized protein n=1 Tax=Tanacetum coccineum TaxID=301880 RepID=A0ABQ5FFC8_9ASTR